MVITGPRAVGTSTVGFGTAMEAWRSGTTTGFVDLQQLGFVSGRDGRTGAETILAISQLATMHRIMADHGAGGLVVSSHLTAADRPTLRAAFPSAAVTVVRLRADEETFWDRVRARADGGAARLAADDVLGANEAHQALVVERALAEQDALDQFAYDDLVLDVSRQTPREVITAIAAIRSC